MSVYTLIGYLRVLMLILLPAADSVWREYNDAV